MDDMSDPAGFWQCGRFRFRRDRPLVMGILNLTPDSFSDGGRYRRPADALAAAFQMHLDGAAIVDIGAESTRPGAEPVDEAEEIERLMPVLEGLRGCEMAVSVDTRRTSVMQAALAVGVDMINDVEALRAPGAIEAMAGSQCGISLMHMTGSPLTMQQAPAYRDVVSEVAGFLQDRVRVLKASGIDPARLVLDPGIGFGKSPEHNLSLLRALGQLSVDGLPMLVGVSRKSLLGTILGRAVDERLAASLAAALAVLARGAMIVRVHDVRETVDALRIWQALGPEAAGSAYGEGSK